MAEIEGETDAGGGRADYLIPRCRTLRESAGWSVARLARAAEVDRNTISKKIERRQGVSAAVANCVFNALNKQHGGRLKAEKEITRSRRGL
jgi:transcriptional regulator with XRE-family HTH domain